MNRDVAAQFGVCEDAVGKWRRQFIAQRLDGLRDEPRSGAPRSIDDDRIEAVIVRTLERLPENATFLTQCRYARPQAGSMKASCCYRIDVMPRHCYVCDSDLNGPAQRRFVTTGTSSRIYFGRSGRISTSSGSYRGSRLVCNSCAAEIDAREKAKQIIILIAVSAVIAILVIGALSSP